MVYRKRSVISQDNLCQCPHTRSLNQAGKQLNKINNAKRIMMDLLVQAAGWVVSMTVVVQRQWCEPICLSKLLQLGSLVTPHFSTVVLRITSEQIVMDLFGQAAGWVVSVTVVAQRASGASQSPVRLALVTSSLITTHYSTVPRTGGSWQIFTGSLTNQLCRFSDAVYIYWRQLSPSAGLNLQNSIRYDSNFVGVDRTRLTLVKTFINKQRSLQIWKTIIRTRPTL